MKLKKKINETKEKNIKKILRLSFYKEKEDYTCHSPFDEVHYEEIFICFEERITT